MAAPGVLDQIRVVLNLHLRPQPQPQPHSAKHPRGLALLVQAGAEAVVGGASPLKKNLNKISLVNLKSGAAPVA